MNSEFIQHSSNQTALVLPMFSVANRIGDSTLRGMVKLSQLNAQALIRTVEEHGTVAGEVQESDAGRAVALQGQSVVADGTKLFAYTAHVGEIYLTTMGEIASECGKFYADAVRSTVDASQHIWSAMLDRSGSPERIDQSVAQTFGEVAHDA